MRQYAIYYRRGGGKFGRLEANAHHSLYSRPEVSTAIGFMQTNPTAEGVAVRLGDELFNIMSLAQEAIAPNAFVFDPIDA